MLGGSSSNSLVNFFKNMAIPEGTLVKCKRCGCEFPKPLWFFEGLCDDCFTQFDKAKMEGRFNASPRCENSDIWMRDNPFTREATGKPTN